MELKANALMQTDFSKNSSNAVKAPNKAVAQETLTAISEQQNTAIKKGYANVTEAMSTANIRGKAIKVLDDGRENYAKLGMLALNAIPSNGPKSVAVELSTIRRDTITMMNKLPIEINIKVADEIKQLIHLNKWPTDVEEINKKIKEISASINEP